MQPGEVIFIGSEISIVFIRVFGTASTFSGSGLFSAVHPNSIRIQLINIVRIIRGIIRMSFIVLIFQVSLIFCPTIIGFPIVSASQSGDTGGYTLRIVSVFRIRKRHSANLFRCIYCSTTVVYNNRENLWIASPAELTPGLLSVRKYSNPFLGDDALQFFQNYRSHSI